jgi:hypothetical protein
MGGLAVTMVAGLVAAGAGLLVVLCLVGVGFSIRRLRRAEGDVAAMIWAIRSMVGFLFAALLLSLVISIALDVDVPGIVPPVLVACVIAMTVLLSSRWRPHHCRASGSGPWPGGPGERRGGAPWTSSRLEPDPTLPPFPPRPPTPPMPPPGGGLAP